MGDRFKKGKVYICNSINGSAPSFYEKDDWNAEASLFGQKEDSVRIESEDGKIYKYRRDTVTFKPGTAYEVVSVKPHLTMKGTVNIPFDKKYESSLARTSFDVLLYNSGINSSPGILEFLSEHYDWKLKNLWDGTLDGLKEIITEDLQHFCTRYKGSPNGYLEDNISCKLLLHTLFDSEEAYAWVHLREKDALPYGMRVLWGESEGPKAFVGEIPFRKWMDETLSFVEEGPEGPDKDEERDR